MPRHISSRWIVGWIAVVFLAVAVACGSDSGSSSSSSGDCGRKATDDCTPTVGPNQSLTVDAISYRIKNATTASTVGDPNFLGETAKGVYIIVTLNAKSYRKETGTFTTDVFKIYAGGKTYDADDAAVTAFKENFFLEDIGPDTSGTGKLAFDVAPKVLKKKPKLRIGELGLGSTYGYIRLPKLN